MNFYVFKSRFNENKFPIYVISNEDPQTKKDWNHPAYERVFIGHFSTYREALGSIDEYEPNFSEWKELDDSFLQGETVFVKE